MAPQTTVERVGFRNSHDKSMVAGICAGARVFVCDNLAFSGDFSEKRKHTPGNNFIRLIREAFTLLPGQLENLTKNLDRLKTEGISQSDAQKIIWRAAIEGAIACPPTPDLPRLGVLSIKDSSQVVVQVQLLMAGYIERLLVH